VDIIGEMGKKDWEQKGVVGHNQPRVESSISCGFGEFVDAPIVSYYHVPKQIEACMKAFQN
jgi:hypothetical protein